jgi:hypothetical protein
MAGTLMIMGKCNCAGAVEALLGSEAIQNLPMTPEQMSYLVPTD